MVGFRAQALAKHAALIDAMRERVSKAKIARLLQYEKDHKAVIRDFDFKPGSLVLVRNTGIESSLDRKMKARYLGPGSSDPAYTGRVICGSRTKRRTLGTEGGAVSRTALFCREKIALPGKLLNWLAVAPETLQKLLDAEEPEDGAPGEVVDLSMDNIDPVPGDDPDASAESDTE